MNPESTPLTAAEDRETVCPHRRCSNLNSRESSPLLDSVHHDSHIVANSHGYDQPSGVVVCSVACGGCVDRNECHALGGDASDLWVEIVFGTFSRVGRED